MCFVIIVFILYLFSVQPGLLKTFVPLQLNWNGQLKISPTGYCAVLQDVQSLHKEAGWQVGKLYPGVSQ